jgi:2',3'-cyclic-nucleotide 2'-phosphodiesterase (5'-nucleotidase family)
LTAEGAKADAMLVLAHMDAHHPLIATIVRAIRAQGLPNIPIQVIADHSHRRLTITINPHAGVFEPGNRFNTIGFASFDLPPPTANSTGVAAMPTAPLALALTPALTPAPNSKPKSWQPALARLCRPSNSAG